jgi:mannosylglucosylglycerate synthase
MKIAIIHYSSWPVIGGVESVIRQHALLLARNGHEVAILCGSGTGFSKQIPIKVFRELNSRDPKVKIAQDEVYSGHPGPAYFRLIESLQTRLVPLLKRFDRIIVHNLFTMPFVLAATDVLAKLAEVEPKLIAWTHDIAANNPDYKIPAHKAFDLIRRRQPNVKYVTISQARAAEFKKITGTVPDAVIPNGLEVRDLWNITPEVAEIVREDLADSMILFYPTRILARKNIGFGLQIVAALRDAGVTVRFLISGAPDPHNQKNNSYFTSLKRLATDLDLDRIVTWVNDHFFVDERQMRSLYAVSDALLYPTRQEGFGLPLLEGAAYRLSVFCSNIEPLKSIAPPGTVLFDLRDAPRVIAGRIRTHLESSDIYKSRKQILRDYSADRIYAETIEPLLQEKL